MPNFSFLGLAVTICALLTDRQTDRQTKDVINMDRQLPTALAAAGIEGQLTRDKAITSIVLPLSREVFAPAGSSSHLPAGSTAA